MTEGTKTETGKFIVLEGPDGVGKTTQAHLLVDTLRKGGADVIYTSEPTDERVGVLAREAISDKETGPIEQVTLLAADRRRHCREVICPALREGKIVICDRFTLTTHAYQTSGLFSAYLQSLIRVHGIAPPTGQPEASASYGRVMLNHAIDIMGLAKSYCEANKWIADIHYSLPVPDLYVVLLATSDVIEARVRARGVLSDQDKRAVEFASAYSFIAADPGIASVQAGQLAVLDAGITQEELADAIFNVCAQVLA